MHTQTKQMMWRDSNALLKTQAAVEGKVFEESPSGDVIFLFVLIINFPLQ